MAIILWILGIYVGLVVVSLTMPYIVFRIQRKTGQETIEDYVNWMNNDEGRKSNYVENSFIPVMNIVTTVLAIYVVMEAIITLLYNRIKDIKIV